MSLASNKTKLVCTIGPASESPEILVQMLQAGMNVARLNFSHGDFEKHKSVIETLRNIANSIGKPVTILVDLPGPKMRIGQLAEERIKLKRGDAFTLTTDDTIGDQKHVSVSFQRLHTVVKSADHLFINDGNIQLEVVKIVGTNVECRVLIGGELRSRNGLNIPGIDLGVKAFTDHDHECLKFALENGVNAFSQSFVETAADIDSVRKAAANLGYKPFIIAKIERAQALMHIDEILKAADGIMVARGDLGVETPLENIAMVQKQIIRKANLLGKPVITATQMLESMVNHYRPTRAECTDVANAILDGTDAVMLSEESAMGKYPVRAVEMLSRFRLPVWIAAVSRDEVTCDGLQFSYGVLPILVVEEPSDWIVFAQQWAKSEKLEEGRIVLTEAPSKNNPDANPRLEIFNLAIQPKQNKKIEKAVQS